MKLAILVITAVSLLLACGTNTSNQNTANPIADVDTSQPLPSFLLDPCVEDGNDQDQCEERVVSGYALFSPVKSGARFTEGSEPTVEEVLEKGLRLADASPVQLAVRGMASAASVRCEWRGIARTPAQREGAIRFWLGLGPQDAVPMDASDGEHDEV